MRKSLGVKFVAGTATNDMCIFFKAVTGYGSLTSVQIFGLDIIIYLPILDTNSKHRKEILQRRGLKF